MSQEIPDEVTRRWFSTKSCDLILWNDRRGDLCGFQLCYDKSNDERAFTWHKGRGYSHTRVDAGESIATKNRTPILTAIAILQPELIAAALQECRMVIDAATLEFINAKVKEYSKSPSS